MASFTRCIGSAKNGKKIGVNGKSRTSIPRATFIRICGEENGDCRKISQRLYGDEKHANQVSLRYENLVKKGVQLPPMVFVKLRKHVPMTPELQRKLASEWNRLQGDTTKVAKSLGISTATVYSWIKKFDYLYFRKNVEIIAKKFGITLEEAEQKLMEKGTFVSNLCEKKVGKRGRQSSITADVVEDIESEMGDLLESFEEDFMDDEENEEENVEQEDMSDILQ